MEEHQEKPKKYNKGNEIVFTIHDEIHTVKANEISPDTTLNTYIRNKLGLKGTKFMCLEGGCGTCCVVIKRTHPVTNRVKTEVVNSCLLNLYACHGLDITTIEGVGNSKKGYNEIQKRIANYHGTQCGMCTPGMVMNMYALTQEKKMVLTKDIEKSYGGNLCRCTGYRPIMDALVSMAYDSDKNLDKYPDIEDAICSKTGKLCVGKCRNDDWDVIHGDEQKMITVKYDDSVWYKVYKIADLLNLFKTIGNSTYKLLSGNTAIAIYKNDPPAQYYIDITSLNDIYGYNLNTSLDCGAGTTISEAQDLFSVVGQNNSNFTYLQKISDHINKVATMSVRNWGSIGGNIMLKYKHNDFPSDIWLLFEACGAQGLIVDRNGSGKLVSMLDLLKTPMNKSILKRIVFPPLNNDTHTYYSYKISPRYYNAHAIVNCAFLIEFSPNYVVKRARICYGGINPSFCHAYNTENYLVGKVLYDNTTIQGAIAMLNNEVKPDNNILDADPNVRRNMTITLFYKFILKTAPSTMVSPRNRSGGAELERPLCTGTQIYQTNQSQYPLTEPVNKLEALKQTSGEVEYVTDIPACDELYCAYVLAEVKPFSTVQSIDTSEAKKLKGVVACFTADDVPGSNTFSPPILSRTIEELLVSKRVQYSGQAVVIVVGKTQEIADKGASLVVVVYQESVIEKPYYTIKEVLNSPLAATRIIPLSADPAIRRGTDIKHTLQGEFSMGAQYHMPMETQTAFCKPNDSGGLTVHASTQWKDHVQASISHSTGIPMNKVDVFCKRVGGAYGCKIIRASYNATMCAIASYLLNRPVRSVLSLETNMKMIGKRCPVLVKFNVGYNDVGLIQYCDVTFYHDAGKNLLNEPFYLFFKEVVKGIYLNDTFTIIGSAVETDMPGNCWCRAPGSVDGVGCIEMIMDYIAFKSNLDPVAVRLANVDPNNKFILDLVKQTVDWTDYYKRKDEIQKFNDENMWKKRGLSICFMNYDMLFLGPHIVSLAVYTVDATVICFHGGCECGQGINTKVVQVISYLLKIPMDKIEVKTSNSCSTPNNIMTGGSVGSELICYAAQKACQKILDRLQPIKTQFPNLAWPELVAAAAAQNISLMVTEMYTTSDPNIKKYYVNGGCVSEVESDLLTGERVIRETHILEDVGSSMNPSIDWGQVEGAFAMGVGWYTLEKMIIDENGSTRTNNTWNYKIPGFKEIPSRMNIKFLPNSTNPYGVLNSKAVGEPPLCLSFTVMSALRQNARAARKQAVTSVTSGNNPLWYDITQPETVEENYKNFMNNPKQFLL